MDFIIVGGLIFAFHAMGKWQMNLATIAEFFSSPNHQQIAPSRNKWGKNASLVISICVCRVVFMPDKLAMPCFVGTTLTQGNPLLSTVLSEN